MIYILQALYIVAAPFIAGALGILYGMALKGVDRRLTARMQGRIGPPLRQPFYDVLKLFEKESIIPENSITWLFNAAPLIALATSITTLLYLPIGPFPSLFSGEGDLIVILYLLELSVLAMVAGGFASGSPYASVGSQREIVLMISSQLPLATTIITLAWKYSLLYPGIKAFSLATFVNNPIWNNVGILGFIGVGILLITLLMLSTAGLGRLPFDIAEAGTEISGGMIVEYSGRNLGILYINDAVRVIVFATLVNAIFFPYKLSPIIANYVMLPLAASLTIDFLFYLFKVFLIAFITVTVMRVAFPRYRVDDVVKFYWGITGLATLAALILITMDAFFG